MWPVQTEMCCEYKIYMILDTRFQKKKKKKTYLSIFFFLYCSHVELMDFGYNGLSKIS